MLSSPVVLIRTMLSLVLAAALGRTKFVFEEPFQLIVDLKPLEFLTAKLVVIGVVAKVLTPVKVCAPEMSTIPVNPDVTM